MISGLLTDILAMSIVIGVLLAGLCVLVAHWLPARALNTLDQGNEALFAMRLPHFRTLALKPVWLDAALIAAILLCTVLVFHYFGLHWRGAAALLFCSTILTLARIDLETGLLPDALTLPLLFVGLGFHIAGGWDAAGSSLAGWAFAYGTLRLIFALYRWKTGQSGMGGGDFKLAGSLGAWLGIEAVPLLLLMASLSGALTGLVAQRWFGLAKGSAIPFGPFLAVAGMLILFAGGTRHW